MTLKRVVLVVTCVVVAVLGWMFAVSQWETASRIATVASALAGLEDNLALAGRLSAADNDVELRVYPESPHGFTGHPTAMARTALSGVDSWLRDRITQS